jgi:hypothetical protein
MSTPSVGCLARLGRSRRRAHPPCRRLERRRFGGYLPSDRERPRRFCACGVYAVAARLGAGQCGGMLASEARRGGKLEHWVQDAAGLTRRKAKDPGAARATGNAIHHHWTWLGAECGQAIPHTPPGRSDAVQLAG